MVRSKQTRPLATRPNNCPVDNLPSEILHIVCTYLKPTDVANLRLASSALAPIGLQYLAPEVQLTVAEDNFRKLAAIAIHPVVSKYVTSLFYQANTLEVFDEERWRGVVRSLDYNNWERFREARPSYMLRSCKESYHIQWPVRRHHYTEKQLKEAFREYQGFCEYQGRVDRFDRKIFTAMKQLPNLKELTVSVQDSPHQMAFEKAFPPGLLIDCQEDVEERPFGLAQRRSLLLGAYRAGSKIERLTCDGVNWRILTQENKTFESMKKSLRHLRELGIVFTTIDNEGEDALGSLPIEKCQIYLQGTGRLKEFVTSAPDLERLEICFQRWNPVYPTEFQYVVSDFYWPSLSAIDFMSIDGAEDHLVEFFERHACTIKDLCIGYLSLSTGCWRSALERMRLVLKLDSVHLSGSLENSTEYLDIDDKPQDDLCVAIESYLLGDNTDQRISLADYLEDF